MELGDEKIHLPELRNISALSDQEGKTVVENKQITELDFVAAAGEPEPPQKPEEHRP